MTITRIFLALAVSAFALALQEPAPKSAHEIPLCEGAECDGGHEGQPQHCQNYNDSQWKKNCDCKRDCDDHNQDGHRESGCSTYCRTPSCRCNHECPTQ